MQRFSAPACVPTCLGFGSHEAEGPGGLCRPLRLAACATSSRRGRSLLWRPPLQPHHLLPVAAGRQERGGTQSADGVRSAIHNNGHTANVPACLPTATLAGRPHRVVCSLVRKNPSGCLALKDPEMRLSRQAAAPTLAQ